jgi:signal transduction histidine kinase
MNNSILLVDDDVRVLTAVQRMLHRTHRVEIAFGRQREQGLSVAHAVIVKKHGGTLSFETEYGKGSTFLVQLPFVQSGEE